jgi:hypothetical protein
MISWLMTIPASAQAPSSDFARHGAGSIEPSTLQFNFEVVLCFELARSKTVSELPTVSDRKQAGSPFYPFDALSLIQGRTLVSGVSSDVRGGSTLANVFPVCHTEKHRVRFPKKY